MRLADVGELRLIEELSARFPPFSNDITAAIGDDAAALELDGRTLLLSTDMMIEGVHFDPALFTPYQIGFKLVSSGVSDIFAMGGRPRWCLLNLALPAETEESFLGLFLDGLSEAMRRYRLQLVGGDTAGSRLISTALTVAGTAGERLIRRSGASVGDGIYVSGPLGEASCGYELLKVIGSPVRLERGERCRLPISWRSAEALLRRFLLPEAVEPPVRGERITSMIDVSDGLFLDLTRLCRESSVGARLYEERIPVTEALRECSAFLGRDPYGFITAGGEDYQQLFTAGGDLDGPARIGEVTEEGLYIVRKDGSEQEIRPEGYQHFADQR